MYLYKRVQVFYKLDLRELWLERRGEDNLSSKWFKLPHI